MISVANHLWVDICVVFLFAILSTNYVQIFWDVKLSFLFIYSVLLYPSGIIIMHTAKLYIMITLPPRFVVHISVLSTNIIIS